MSIMLSKFDTAGGRQWDWLYHSKNHSDWSSRAVIDQSGTIYIAGSSYAEEGGGGDDGLLLKVYEPK